MKMIPVAGPSTTKKEIEYVAKATAGDWYQNAGRFNARFERAFADYVGARHAISLPSCTSAIHLSLAALGIGPDHEVLDEVGRDDGLRPGVERTENPTDHCHIYHAAKEATRRWDARRARGISTAVRWCNRPRPELLAGSLRRVARELNCVMARGPGNFERIGLTAASAAPVPAARRADNRHLAHSRLRFDLPQHGVSIIRSAPRRSEQPRLFHMRVLLEALQPRA
jgi:DegT/DnrJ/EryC1/StrS aminotransferase family